TCDQPDAFATTEIGLERVAREHHLATLEDIEIDRSAHHPLLEVTTQLIRRFDPADSTANPRDP
ncbi:MAG TPA: hypothetical protein VGS18_02810, partial [Thermoplasmata archaeon]|nr:hypothetical protein [Thermoplasmata archaeon]